VFYSQLRQAALHFVGVNRACGIAGRIRDQDFGARGDLGGNLVRIGLEMLSFRQFKRHGNAA